MTYEERQQYQEKREQIDALRESIGSEAEGGAINKEQALRLLDVLEYLLHRTSPERFDQALEVVAEEAARRAEVLSSRRL